MSGLLPPPLPPAQGTTYRVALVCLGNICRSPIADVVLNRRLEEEAAAGRPLPVEVTSAGTAEWHVGNPMDERAAAVLHRASYDPSRHRARQFGADWYDHDLVLAMDASNRQAILDQLPEDRHHRVLMFRAFDPVVRSEPVPDVPDPYYGGDEGFDEVLAMVERTAARLVAALADSLHM